jgi:hypothetical protein
MILFYTYPFAKAPDYARPNVPIQAFVLNDAMSDVVDAQELPYDNEEGLAPWLDRLMAKHGIEPVVNSQHLCDTLGVGVVDEFRTRQVASFMTPEKAAALLALLDTPRKKRKKLQKEQVADLIAMAEKQKAEDAAVAREFDAAFKELISKKFPDVSTDWW